MNSRNVYGAVIMPLPLQEFTWPRLAVTVAIHHYSARKHSTECRRL